MAAGNGEMEVGAGEPAEIADVADPGRDLERPPGARGWSVSFGIKEVIAIAAPAASRARISLRMKVSESRG